MIRCPRCKREIEKPEVRYGRRGMYCLCTCGREIHLIRQPQPAQARVRPHMSKKERRRQRKQNAGGAQ